MYKFIFLIPVLILLLCACGGSAEACPSAQQTQLYISQPPETLPTPTPSRASLAVEINGKTIPVDKIVSGMLCHDEWYGTVYVTCNVQVYPWEETPTFLKNCNLTIYPGTVVYVAAHNNTAFYNGCSCHTGELVQK